MLSPVERELRFGHRIQMAGRLFVVVNAQGETQLRTSSNLKALDMLKKLRAAWMAGKYHSTDAPPPAGKIAVA